MKKNIFLIYVLFLVLYGSGSLLFADRVDELINDLNSDSSSVRWKAVMFLGQEKDVRAVDPLIKVIASDQNYGVRVEAIKSLGKIGDKRAIETLKPLLKSKDESIRRAAAGALTSIQSSLGGGSD
ncbi:MAG: HEAT repeat domain-containing protein [Candidatus Aureabacteria bacterium]|nr:HEAT repeat domain-containing protein [Candidatus Auribacterota bacterium]